jgi:DNA polymerase III subunit delta
MAQIFLLTGQNAWRIREERKYWKDQFSAKHGQDNLLTLHAGDVTFRSLLDEAGSAPFLSEKRLVVIDGIPRFTKEEVELLPSSIHPDSILVFCESSPDKRLGGTKALLALADVRDYPTAKGAALMDWLRGYASAAGCTLDADAARELVSVAGEDQETLAREMDKCAAYAKGRAISLKDVRLLAVPSGEQQVWKLTNLLSAGKIPEALHYARDMQARGEDAYSLWAVLLWMLRSVVSVHAAAADGERNPGSIASSAGVPFPTVQNVLPFASSLSQNALRGVVAWAAEADIDLKMGGYRSTADAPQELQALIDGLILRCGALKA